ncbi:MAG: NAD(P)/FAD-dependent oxidoreductase [Leptolyngbya sp. SIO4C1]|nr:NAD(P)/FAD-dependent oxidoreductase [Leptolyngbya sp. SIO4C1]
MKQRQATGQVQAVVIGGGAAGFFGAIAAAEAGAAVTLFEAGPTPLAKVKISGGGRCNVTHRCFDPVRLVQHYPRGSKALLGAFSRFQPKDTVAWFQQRGVQLKTEADGRMFPTTDDSATIVDCLRQAAAEAGVRLRMRSPIASVIPAASGFDIGLKSGEQVHCDRLLLATGSSPQGYRLAQSLGHTLISPVPSLFTFTIADAKLRQLSGLTVDPAMLKLTVAGLKKPLVQTGPLLITHWGLSGPAVLKLSAWGARWLHGQRYRAQLSLNWLPEHSSEAVRQQLQQAKQAQARRAMANYSPLGLPKRLWHYLLQRCAIAQQLTWANLSKKSLNCLVQALTQSQYDIDGKGTFKEEFVTCGGVQLKDVDFKTMQSRRCAGLYFAGEILDIDGVTGGFNFQSAWTTGWLAGQAIANCD